MNDVMTKKDICDWLKIGVATVDRWRVQGMPSVKLGRMVRFERKAVQEWLDNKKGE